MRLKSNGVANGSVTVYYVDEGGNQIESPSIYTNLSYGIHTYYPKDICGYVINDPTSKSAVLNDQHKHQDITFVYRKSELIGVKGVHKANRSQE